MIETKKNIKITYQSTQVFEFYFVKKNKILSDAVYYLQTEKFKNNKHTVDDMCTQLNDKFRLRSIMTKCSYLKTFVNM